MIVSRPSAASTRTSTKAQVKGWTVVDMKNAWMAHLPVREEIEPLEIAQASSAVLGGILMGKTRDGVETGVKENLKTARERLAAAR
jgi:hypothetical protein